MFWRVNVRGWNTQGSLGRLTTPINDLQRGIADHGRLGIERFRGGEPPGIFFSISHGVWDEGHNAFVSFVTVNVKREL